METIEILIGIYKIAKNQFEEKVENICEDPIKINSSHYWNDTYHDFESELERYFSKEEFPEFWKSINESKEYISENPIEYWTKAFPDESEIKDDLKKDLLNIENNHSSNYSR